MPKPSKPGSGKDRGSLTQKADNQQVRISQVSNVSQAVSAMGKETTRRMQETDRRIAEGGDSKEIAGSMNSVLNSLKTTVDSLNKGVEAATLGTAKAAQEAIAQYGQAISEDFKINRQNMVASALSTSTPIFGYFASKFFETGVFKKTKDRMSESISNIFKKKSKGGSLPDEFDMDEDGAAPGKKLTPAQAAEKARQNRVVNKKDNLNAMKIANREKYEQYDRLTEQKTLAALVAIQGAVGATIGKFSQWYSKFLIEHPYYRRTMMAFKYLAGGAAGVWKAAYFIFRPRGGYKKHLSKAKNPFQAINQNLGALFVHTMPRLDAIMIYTKATAIAMRDLSSHVTGKKYAMMDPSKLGGTWSIGGVTMSIMRGAGRVAMKGARKLRDSMFDKGTTGHDIFSGAIEGTETLGKIADYSVTGPGRIKDWIKGKTLDQLAGAKEKRRMFGGLEGTEGGFGGGFGGGQAPCVRICPETDGILGIKHEKQMRLPKAYKGMGKRIKPSFFTQGVFDEYFAKEAMKKEKQNKKLLGYTASTSDELKEHNKREKRRTATGIIGGLFSKLGGLFSGAMGLLGGLFGGGGGMKGILTGLAMNPLVWKAAGITGALFGTKKIWDWLDNKFGDGGTLGNTIFTSFRNAFPQFDAQSAAMDGIMGGFSRMFKGQDFDFGQVVKDSLDGLWDRKFGFDFKTWMKAMKGDMTPEEKKVLFEKQMKKQYGEDRYAMELKAQRVNEAKGVKEKSKAYLGLVGGWARSKLGMDMGESEIAITAMRAKKLVDKYGGRAEDYLSLKYEDGVALGKKIWAANQQKLTAAKDRLSDIAKVTMADAQELAAKYGGHAREYVHKKWPEAKTYGLKLQEKAAKAKEYLKEQALKAGDYYKKNLEELSARDWAKKKGLKLEGAGGRLVEAAERQYGKGTKFTAEQWAKVKKWAEEEDLVIEGSGGRLKDAAMRKYEKGKQWMMGEGPENLLKKTGEYIEIGKGNFVEIYRQGAGNVKEMWETATPEKKAWIRQNAEKLFASGQITKEELQKLGIKLKDATLEGAEKVGSAVVTSAVQTTNNISSAVSNMQSGGGGGNSNKFMQEQTMDEIAMGNVLF